MNRFLGFLWLTFFVKLRNVIKIFFSLKMARENARFESRACEARTGLKSLVGLIGGASALIIFKLLYDGRARSLLQATAKPRAKAYRVKPGQNHGSPRLASSHLRRISSKILSKYSAIPSPDGRESRSTFAAQFGWWVMKIGAREGKEKRREFSN